ncbi:MAG TPA: Holliday junction branch migration protein RuvA [bacterium]|jgi:Holliday junction DNA helicase RuvA
MIDFVEGILVAKSPSQAVILTGGLGVRGNISLATYDELPLLGEQIRLWTHLQLREEELTLFAFATQEERWMFLHLITVNGVGPKLAMVALSAARTDTLRRAIIEGDSDRLKSIPRIGSKIAERIVLELKKKLSDESPSFEVGVSSKSDEIQQAVSALCALGFTRAEAEKSVDGAVKRGGKGVEELVKLSLRMS